MHICMIPNFRKLAKVDKTGNKLTMFAGDVYGKSQAEEEKRPTDCQHRAKSVALASHTHTRKDPQFEQTRINFEERGTATVQRALRLAPDFPEPAGVCMHGKCGTEGVGGGLLIGSLLEEGGDLAAPLSDDLRPFPPRGAAAQHVAGRLCATAETRLERTRKQKLEKETKEFR